MLDELLTEVTEPNQQPIIIIVGDYDTLKVDQLFIKCDQKKIIVPGKDTGLCLDYFFKLFCVFNLVYCPQLNNFMNFFEIILNMKSEVKKPAISEFVKKVLN